MRRGDCDRQQAVDKGMLRRQHKYNHSDESYFFIQAAAAAVDGRRSARAGGVYVCARCRVEEKNEET